MGDSRSYDYPEQSHQLNLWNTVNYTRIMANAHLFYLVGASGVGKDSLLSYARHHLPAKAPVVFAHRYITRAMDDGSENHIALSENEFENRRARGCFAMHWRSHGLNYGIGIEVQQWLEGGLNVVVNGSRAYLRDAADRFPCLQPVLVRATAEVLRQRLEQRGREDLAQIQQRLERAAQLDDIVHHTEIHRIDNNGALEDAGKHLLRIVVGQDA